MRVPLSPCLAARRRAAALVAAVLVVLLVVPALPAQAAGWPSVFHAYGRFDGTTFNDPLDQPSGNAIADLTSGITTLDATGPLSSTYVAADGNDLLVRFRLKTTPGSTTGAGGWDTAKGGLNGFAYVVQLSVNGTHVASLGLDGTTSASDYVYVAPVNDVTVGGTTYTSTVPRVVSTWNGTSIPGARLTNAGTAAAPAETFLDFRVPLSDITLVAPSVTATTPVQFFFGTSAAANLITINKDYMAGGQGTTCAMLGCAALTIGPSTLGLEWTNTPTHVSGPNPPAVGETSAYDLTVTATNKGLNELSSIEIADALPAHVSVLSATTASGTASVSNGTVSWAGANLKPGERATMKMRVAVAPNGSWHGRVIPLSNGPSGTAVDVASGTMSSASLSAQSVGPVAGSATSADFAVAKTGPATAVAGADVAYELDVHNRGPAAGTPTVVDTLPSGLTFVSATGTGWSCAAAGQVVTCSRESALAAGTSATPVTVVATSDATITGDRTNSVSSQPAAGSDDNTSNNVATATTTFSAPPAVAVSETPTPTEDPTVEVTETATPTEDPTVEVTETATPTEDPTVEVTESPTPTEDPTVEVTETPTPTEDPTVEVTESPTPTEDPTVDVTETPTPDVTEPPTEEPTQDPTEGPTQDPTEDPTQDPTEDAELPLPVANDDYAGGRTGEAVTVDVLANDAAPDSALDPTTVAVTSGLAHGAILDVNESTGAVTYRPDAAYEGTDEFTYSVCNVAARCDTTRVFTATPPVDLEVTIVRTSDRPASGQTATYDVTVTNLGPRFADGPLTLTLSASPQLTELSAAGDEWLPDDPSTAPAASGRTVQRLGAPAVSLQLPAGLAVGAPSLVKLTGLVAGEAGAQVRVDAQVAGASIELVYANNESSASDNITATDPDDPAPPTDPDDPTPPTDPDDPRPPTDNDAVDDGTAPPSSGGVDRTAATPTAGTERTLAATGAGAAWFLLSGLGGLAAGHTLLRLGADGRRPTRWSSAHPDAAPPKAP